MATRQSPPSGDLIFTAAEVEQLGRTADAMSAWMGKPVLAEVIAASETGFEWVVFGVPLRPGQTAADLPTVQIGGRGARLIGSQGGLAPAASDAFSCELLWAIQLTDIQGLRFIKIDSEGDEVAWSDNLDEMLPFDLRDPDLVDESEPDDESQQADSGADPRPGAGSHCGHDHHSAPGHDHDHDGPCDHDHDNDPTDDTRGCG